MPSVPPFSPRVESLLDSAIIELLLAHVSNDELTAVRREAECLLHRIAMLEHHSGAEVPEAEVEAQLQALISDTVRPRLRAKGYAL